MRGRSQDDARKEKEKDSQKGTDSLVLLTKDIKIKMFPVLKVSIRFMRIRLACISLEKGGKLKCKHHKTAAEDLFSARMRHLCC